MIKEKVVYYKDELNDEFSIPTIKPRRIDKNYKYKHNFIWDLCSLIIQNVLSMPIKISYAKIRFRIKFIGTEKLKNAKNTGYFIYANHTQPFADTFIPSIANYPKRNFLLVNPVNISLKGTGTIVEMLGAIPIPDDKEAMKNFFKVLEEKIKSKNSITIYPEAHIWPYYTKIRPFKDVSFKYPAKLNVPIFTITNTYQKREQKTNKKNKTNKENRLNKKNEKVNITTYIDGPFYPDETLPLKQQQKELRDKAYNIMQERSKNSNIEVIKYVMKKEKTVIL